MYNLIIDLEMVMCREIIGGDLTNMQTKPYR